MMTFSDGELSLPRAGWLGPRGKRTPLRWTGRITCSETPSVGSSSSGFLWSGHRLGLQEYPLFQTIPSTPKQAKSNASTDHYLKPIWINEERLRSTLRRALIYNGKEMVTGLVPARFRFGILHCSLCTSAQHLFTPLECEFYE